MRYYVGIDGGGTKTLGYLGDDRGNILTSIEVGATNYHTVGLQKTEETLKELLHYFKIKENVAIEHIDSLCFGGAGIDCRVDEETMEALFRKIGYHNNLRIVNDGIIALVGANGEEKGAVLISGTGSITLGMNSNGRVYRVGGWGHLIDDLGSGYHIGVLALKKIMESYDGREVKTLLWERISTILTIDHQEALMSYIYAPERTKQDIASLAVCVLDLAGEDAVADGILDTAVEGLVTMVVALIDKMEETKLSLGLGGSILLKSQALTNKLQKKLHKLYPELCIHLPYRNAAEGALILALKRGD